MYKGTCHCFLKTIRNEGIRGLFQGLAPPLTSTVPIFAISFMTYRIGKDIFVPSPPDHPTIIGYFLAGGLSGVFTVVIMAPAERIKCLLQIQLLTEGAPHLYDGSLDCLIKLYKEGGIIGIYRGSGVTLLRDVPGSGAYYATYDCLKDYLTDYGKTKMLLPGTIMAGGLAGVFFWLVGIPADVVKSRLQTAPAGTYPNGMVSVFVELMKIDGPTGLYRGLVAVSLRSFPANAACFVGFELCKKMLDYSLGKS